VRRAHRVACRLWRQRQRRGGTAHRGLRVSGRVRRMRRRHVCLLPVAVPAAAASAASAASAAAGAAFNARWSSRGRLARMLGACLGDRGGRLHVRRTDHMACRLWRQRQRRGGTGDRRRRVPRRVRTVRWLCLCLCLCLVGGLRQRASSGTASPQRQSPRDAVRDPGAPNNRIPTGSQHDPRVRDPGAPNNRVLRQLQPCYAGLGRRQPLPSSVRGHWHWMPLSARQALALRSIAAASGGPQRVPAFASPFLLAHGPAKVRVRAQARL